MSKEGTSAESNDDEHQDEDSDLFLQVDIVECSERSCDTTLQDLPIQLLGCILVKAVAMEVKSEKLDKSAWKEQADLVISRLRTVCSKWNSILTTNKFRNEVYRTLGVIAQKTIHLEILHQFSMPFHVIKLITMKDEIFMLRKPNGQDHVINVYDRNKLAEAKDVIQLEGVRPGGMAVCSVSDCVYVLHLERNEVVKEWQSVVVFRITKDEDNHFEISGEIGHSVRPSFADISVSANGNLIILSKHDRPEPSVVTIFDVNGSWQHEITLHPHIYGFRYACNVIQKSDGNLLLVSANYQCMTKLQEIDTTGRMVRQYQSSRLTGYSVVNFADASGKILITDWSNKMALLDSELCLLDFKGPRPAEKESFFAYDMHYDSQRNEIVRIDDTDNPGATLLTVYRFKED